MYTIAKKTLQVSLLQFIGQILSRLGWCTGNAIWPVTWFNITQWESPNTRTRTEEGAMFCRAVVDSQYCLPSQGLSVIKKSLGQNNIHVVQSWQCSTFSDSVIIYCTLANWLLVFVNFKLEHFNQCVSGKSICQYFRYIRRKWVEHERFTINFMKCLWCLVLYTEWWQELYLLIYRITQSRNILENGCGGLYNQG